MHDHTLPDPAAYARMTFAQRGLVCAALSGSQLEAFARTYAAYLDTLLDGTNVRTDPAQVYAQMMVCAIGWRGMQARQRGCNR